MWRVGDRKYRDRFGVKRIEWVLWEFIIMRSDGEVM